MNGGHYVVAFGEANLHNHLKNSGHGKKLLKLLPCRFNGEITRRAYIFFCLCVIMQPTFFYVAVYWFGNKKLQSIM